ncbi:MAG TPA: hypothetical protein VJ881_07695 [Halanaerobiales bacterium]|nr:hypothetical protein [Halanaerobiales bacterium]
MLSRTETVKRLIKIRKSIQKNEEKLNEASLNNLKNEVDDLLVDVIGAPEKLQYKVNEILTQVIDGNIKIDTALVAIHELVNEGMEPVKYKNKKKNSASKKKRQNYQRNNPDLNITELEKRGWNN